MLAALPLSCSRANGDETANQASGAATKDILARIDDVVITVNDFEEQLNRQMPYVRKRYKALTARKDFLDNLVRFEVLANEAEKRGFDKDPAVVRTMKQVMIKKLLKDELTEQVSLESISEEDMRSFYESNPDEFASPAQVRVAAIITKKSKEAASIAKLANGEQGQTNKGFRDLVDRYSTDTTTKIRGGDLRYFTESTTEVPRPVVEAAFGLAALGDVAGPIRAKGRFYVIKLMGKRPPVNRSFEKAKGAIQNRIYQDRRAAAQDAFIESLRGSATVEVYEKNLKNVKVDTSNTPWSGTQGDENGFPPEPQ